MLLLGGSGRLGSALRRRLPEAMAPHHATLDVLDRDAVIAALDRWRPTVVINCVAYTNVDAAESDPMSARRLNTDVVAHLAAATASRSIRLVTFSTDYVFDGTATTPYVEFSPVGPLNVYGRTKLAGEQAAQEGHPGALVIRTSWLLSATHPSFVSTILGMLDDPAAELTVVEDQRGTPTSVDDLAAAVVAAVNAGVTGVLHLANQGEASWWELARRTAELAGHDADRVRPCPTSDHPRPAPRPAYSVLGSERAGTLDLVMPPWQESLPAVVEGLCARDGAGGRRIG